jgi:hypothetical protein
MKKDIDGKAGSPDLRREHLVRCEERSVLPLGRSEIKAVVEAVAQNLG